MLVLKASNLALSFSKTDKIQVVDHVRVFVGKGHQKLHQFSRFQTTHVVEHCVDEIIPVTDACIIHISCSERLI